MDFSERGDLVATCCVLAISVFLLCVDIFFRKAPLEMEPRLAFGYNQNDVSRDWNKLAKEKEGSEDGIY